MASIIQIRRDTASNWTTANPILALGEMGAETDTSKIKIGDGVTAWASVPYLIDAGDYLTATSTNTLTNKTITFADNTLTGVAPTTTPTLTGVKETKVAIAAAEIDLALGNYFTKSSVGTLTLTLTNEAATGSVSAFVLELANGASPAVTFTFNAGSTVTWAAATAPTLTASGTDVLAFFTYDGGTTWRGFVLGLGMA